MPLKRSRKTTKAGCIRHVKR